VAREALGFLINHRPDDTQALVAVIGGLIIVAAVLLLLWFFPKSIAQGLLPHSSDATTQPLSHQMWFALGTALLGLWFAASSITPMLRNLTVMYVLRPELISAEDLRSLRVGLFYYAVQLALGLYLLFGANGIRKLVWRLRDANAD
jgi:hypothetical protein